jgi:hypothetical protein
MLSLILYISIIPLKFIISFIGKNGQIDHLFPVQIDHQFRSKLTT